MKKLKDTIPNGGAPLGQFPVLRDLFDTENKDAIEALLNSVLDGETQGVILSGCEVSGSSGDFDISAGFIYADGEVLRYPGGEGFSATQYLKKGTVTEESGTFADSVVRAYIDVNVATEYSTTGGGSGTQYVTVTFASGGRTLADRLGDFLNDGIVTLPKMAANSVDSNQYVDGSIDDEHLAEDRVKSVGVQLLTKVVEIGDWNMDANSLSGVLHGLGASFKNIRDVQVIVRDDADTTYRRLDSILTSGTTTLQGALSGIDSTTIFFTRLTGGFFDSTSFDSTSYNRGWVTITYEE